MYETLLAAFIPDLLALCFIAPVVLIQVHKVIENALHGCTFCLACGWELAEECEVWGCWLCHAPGEAHVSPERDLIRCCEKSEHEE